MQRKMQGAHAAAAAHLNTMLISITLVIFPRWLCHYDSGPAQRGRSDSGPPAAFDRSLPMRNDTALRPPFHADPVRVGLSELRLYL